MPADYRARAIEQIQIERSKQALKWGEDHDRGHVLSEWAALLSIRLGKLNAEILDGSDDEQIRRLVQVAAVAQAAFESALANMADD